MVTNGQGNKGPSVAELQKFMREKARIEFHLMNGEKTEGVLRWFDEDAFSIELEEKSFLTILRRGIISYRKLST